MCAKAETLFQRPGVLSASVSAHEAAHQDGITSKPAKAVKAPFDIVHTSITTEGNVAIFHMAVSGKAGTVRPAASGKLAGADVAVTGLTAGSNDFIAVTTARPRPYVAAVPL